MKSKLSIYFILVFAFLSGVIHESIANAEEYTPDMVEMPMKRQKNQFIADPAGYLTADVKEAVNRRIADDRTRTTAEMVVVIVPNTGDMEIEEFADVLFENWGVGKKDKDNGVMLIASIDDKKVNIRPGYGMEGVLTDEVCNNILRSVFVPQMKEGNLDAAVINTVETICKGIEDPAAMAEIASSQGEGEETEGISDEVFMEFCGIVALGFFLFAIGLYVYDVRRLRKKDNYEKSLAWRRHMPTFWILAAVSLGTGLIIALLALWQSKRWRNKKIKCYQCGAKMEKLNEEEDNMFLDAGQDMEEHLNTVDYDVWKCPKCGAIERFPFVQRQFKYKECPNCHVVAMRHKCDRVIVAPTRRRPGIGDREWVCEFCHHDHHEKFDIPKENDDAALGAAAAIGAAAVLGGRGSGGNSSGGGFGGFGGGSSGGGGATAGW